MNAIAEKLIEATGVEIDFHFGVSEYDDGVITLNIMDKSFVDKVVKGIMGRPTNAYHSLYHELGHAVADIYYINDYEETEELFGDFDEEYEGTHALIGSAFLTEDPDFISCYAQTHPEEDWADTFAYVVENYYTIKGRPRTLLQKKIKYVKKWIDGILEEE